MRRYLYFFLTLGFLILWSSCRKDLEFSPSTGNLQFSKDTVYLDTVFTDISSSTYSLKVYNNSDNDISIPSIKLARGDASNYRLSVDGITGKTFENMEILAKDSIYIFVETTIDITNLPSLDGSFLYTDQIEFDSGSNFQKVELVTLVEDAVFIYPNRDNTTKVIETLTINVDGEPVETNIQGRELLPTELTFTNEKPYVIYGFAAVPENETLTIEAGARIYFHNESGIMVLNGASLKVNGAYSSSQELLENEVIFEGDRREPAYNNVPGQWSSIWLLEGSINNEINYATIKNATAGIICDGNPLETNNKLNITNSQIYNSSSYGILGRNTSISGENIVINNSGLSSFAGTGGGTYNVTQSTITNYWNYGFRQYPALLIDNSTIDEEGNLSTNDLIEANFNNCIIYGNDNIEFMVNESDEETGVFNFKFINCLIKFNDYNNSFTTDNYDFTNTNHYENIIFNSDPNFKNTNLNQMIIGDESAAINEGNLTYALQVPFDILNVNRTVAPDLGAYQHVTFEEE